jgi:hypothetical protein
VILGDLLDVVSKSGALLLNVGPKPDDSSNPRNGIFCTVSATGWRSTARPSTALVRSP